jgi:hypothetical protein
VTAFARLLRDHEAHTRDSTDWRAWATLGTVRFSNNDPEGALKALDRAIALGADPADVGMRAIRGDVLDALGRWGDAAAAGPALLRIGDTWTGEPLAGRPLVIICHRFAGDTIRLARYVLRVRGLGPGLVTVAAEPPLQRLLATVGADVVGGRPARLDPPMVVTSDWALAVHVGTEPLPPPTTLWASDPPALDLAPASSPRVGLCWASGVRTGHPVLSDKEFGRCCPVGALDPLYARDVSIVSLQVGPAASERPGGVLGIDGRIGTGLGDWDWADTASVVRQLDAVVTVDTGLAHLAGSLGVPTIVMLPWHAAAFWGVRGEPTSPWYPSVRLVRCRQPGDWTGCVREAGLALDRILAG